MMVVLDADATVEVGWVVLYLFRGLGLFFLLNSDVGDVAPQVLREVPEAKPDGCPVSDLDVGLKLKGAQLRGRFGLVRGEFFLQGRCLKKTAFRSAGDEIQNL